MTFGSLFSGIGGIDLGLERAGMECKWQVEIDPYCQKVLEKHWPHVKRYGDIKTVGEELERVDLIAGGFPCQPVSRAGLRLNQSDERWLWPEFFRIIRLVRPRFVFVENVPGLLDHGIADILGDLAQSGHDAEWESISAASVGAPHIRDRVWILAYAGQQSRDLERRHNWTNGRTHVFPERTDGETSQRSEHRELAALVPGIHPGMASDWWLNQSRVDRTVNGISRKVVDSANRGFGNAVVPQVVEWIGRRIIEATA
jgi:DNA (cytosine-5)-methyltransferase 1